MTITTTLTWRDNELFAGRIKVGCIVRISLRQGWWGVLGDDVIFSEAPTKVSKPAARAALEAKAKEALSNG